MSKQTRISDLFSLGKRTKDSRLSPKNKPLKKKKKKRYIDENDEDDFIPMDIDLNNNDDDFILNTDDLVPEDKDILNDTISPESSPIKHTIKNKSISKRKQTKSTSLKSKSKTLTSPTTTPRRKSTKKEEKRYEWLETIRDINKNLPSDPNYDPRTLYIPKSAFSKLSPFESQFWRVKQKHFDTIVFFKKGKFYELYEMDADVGKKEFDLKMTDRVNMRMVGVPESSIHQWASKFLARGYKITQVDQVESSIAMNRRVKQSSTKIKQDKVIKREVTRILTQGTLLDEGFIADFKSHYLISIKENIMDDSSEYFVSYGICIIDCSIGKILFCTLHDDVKRTELQTLLVQTNPKEFILEKGNISEKTKTIINTMLNNPTCNYLPSNTEFLSPNKTIDKLKELLKTNIIPIIITQQSDLCKSALGACLSYLDLLKISKNLLPNCTFQVYNAIESTNNLFLDGQALINLEILANNVDRSEKGSLFNYLDHCNTKMGQRLLRDWVCSPLINIQEIEERLNIIDWIISNNFERDFQEIFKVFPDIERCISRLRSGRNLKVCNLIQVIESLQNIINFIDFNDYKEDDFNNSILLKELLYNLDPQFIKFKNTLNDFINGFDINKAKVDNCITPNHSDKEYEDAINLVSMIKNKLEEHIIKQKKHLGIPIRYVHMQKEKYQIEISRSDLASIKLPKDFQLVSNTRLVKRFYDSFIQKTLKELADAEEDLNVAKEGVFQRFLEKFNLSYDLWMLIVSRIAKLDVLCSLSIVSSKSGTNMSRPQFIQSNSTYFDVKDMRHPMLCTTMSDRFISNSISLGTTNNPERVILLTGPNMGGKSTLLRQLCLLVIIAQIGCYVPATYCKISPVDRIFTRLGASDDIFKGQSTFMVELQETSTILKYVTNKSLIILDELGRGTSTYDGYSIAYATLAYLSLQTKASILFSTHYHALTDEFNDDKNITLQHMACHVDEDMKDVIFLYKLQNGVCPRSYGMNVALTAGIPKEIVKRANEIAKKFEEKSISNLIT